MSQISAAPVTGADLPVEIPTVDLRQVAPWALFVTLVAGLVIYFVSSEQGAVALLAGSDVHEWVHDARHLLGYPCH